VLGDSVKRAKMIVRISAMPARAGVNRDERGFSSLDTGRVMRGAMSKLS
jgi:hypothetical protein